MQRNRREQRRRNHSLETNSVPSTPFRVSPFPGSESIRRTRSDRHCAGGRFLHVTPFRHGGTEGCAAAVRAGNCQCTPRDLISASMGACALVPSDSRDYPGGGMHLPNPGQGTADRRRCDTPHSPATCQAVRVQVTGPGSSRCLNMTATAGLVRSPEGPSHLLRHGGPVHSRGFRRQ